MVFITAFAIGICVCFLRSVVAYVLAAVLIAGSFALACIASGDIVSLLSLFMAYAGYNSGLVALFLWLVAIQSRTTPHDISW